jgi:hypothetical protein
MATHQRDAALAFLRDRVYLAALTQDPRGLLDDAAVRSAQDLSVTTDPATDVPVAHALGWFCWLRYLSAQPSGHGAQDLDAALRLLAPVYRGNPYAVPQPLQRWFLQADANSFARQESRRAEPLPIFHGVVRATVDAMAAGRGADPERLLDFATSVRGIAAHGGDDGVTAEAAALALAALGGPAAQAPVQAQSGRAFTPEAFLERIRPEHAAGAGPPLEPSGAGAIPLPTPLPRRVPPEARGTDRGAVESPAPRYDDWSARAPAPAGDPWGGSDAGGTWGAGAPGGGAPPASAPPASQRDRAPSGFTADGYPGSSQPERAQRHASPSGWTPHDAPPRLAAGPPAAARHLWAQLPERVGAGQRVPLLVWVSPAGGQGTSAPMKPFDVPGTGRAIIVSVSAPGFELTTDIEQELIVPPDGDSEPIRFGLRAMATGLRHVDVIAFAGGTFLGRLSLQVSVEQVAPVTDGLPRHLELTQVTAQPGEVTLQVNREDGHYSFQLIGSSWYPRVLTQSLAGNPAEVVERILAELRSMARGESGYTSPAAIRERMKNLGTRLWSDVVPDAVRRQFWEQADNISSFVVMSNLDTVPWELLHAVDHGRPLLGFLAEHMPVVRRVYERRPAYRLSLPSAAYVVPPGSPADARAEVDGVRALLGGHVWDRGIVTRLDALQQLFADPPGLLHFACHNSFSPASGSLVRMDGGPVTPDDLEQSKRQLTMAAGNPLVFFNACRTAGEIYGFTQMSGWASQFMAAGAGGFVGTLWPVRSATARVFATSFYEAFVHQSATLGEASLLARKSVSEDLEDPTWLAYTVYGSPTARISP